MTRKYSSTSVEQLLNASIGAGDTTLNLSNSAAVTALLGGVTLAAGNVDQFTIAIDPDTASEEIIFVRGTSGNQLTGLVRGQAGTSATTHSSGATVKHVLTSNDLDYYVSSIDAALTAAGTATLSNKTIALGSNTVSGTIAQFNTALTDGDFTTLAGNETLTNKVVNGSNNTITNISLTTAVTGTLPIANGGTGQTTATAAANALLPSQTSNSGKYLTTDGTNTSWGTITAGGMTSIASGSLSGATVSITSIPQTYKQLVLYLRDYTNSTGAANYSVYFNNTTSTYTATVISNGTVSAASAGSGGIGFTNNATSSGTRENRAVVFIPDYADNSAMQPVYISTTHYDFVAAGIKEAFTVGQFSSGGGVAIDSIYIKADGYSFTGGTYELFGVK